MIWLAPGVYFLLTIMCGNSALCIDRDVTIQVIIPGSVVLDADAVSRQTSRRVIKISGNATEHCQPYWAEHYWRIRGVHTKAQTIANVTVY